MTEADGATPLDPEEMEGLKFTHISTRGQLDQMEQINIQDGIRWLSKQSNPDVLSETFIRRLHIELFGNLWNWAGRFRRTEKSIGVAPEQIAIELRNLLDDARYWIDHQTYSCCEIALRFHHRLVQIHLFPNGNGRHARILTNALLTKHLHASSVTWGHVEMQDMEQQRTDYIAALRSADTGDYLPLLEMFC